MQVTRPPKILIVEDEEILAQDLKETLEELGYNVCPTLLSGEQAVTFFPHIHPDLVLMDIHLQGDVDGIEAAAQITSKFPVPVVFLTAFHDFDTLSRARTMNPYGYLVKPYSKETLHTTLQVALSRHRQDNYISSLFSWLCLTFGNLDRGIITLGKNGEIVLMNTPAEKLTGCTFETVQGRLFEEVFSFYDPLLNHPFVPHTTSVMSESLVIVFPSPTIISGLNRVSCRLQDCVLSPVHENDGSIAGAILVFFAEDNSEVSDQAVRIKGIHEMLKTDISLEQAALCILLGKYEEAMSIYQTLLQKDPNNFQLWYNTGNILIKLERYQESLRAFDRALEIRKDSNESLQRKAELLGRLSLQNFQD